jgi:transposase
MGYIEGSDREQQVLFPKVLDEYVTAENPVRFLDAFVASLDLATLGFQRATPSEIGRPAYEPGDLLRLYLYGYLYRVRSSRKLEQETHRNVELIWLLRRLRPDFKTIADFRRDNPQALRAVCRAFTLVCKQLDLFGGELVAIDGSKFRAVNSKDRNFSRASLERLLAGIDARIAEYLGSLDTQDDAEEALPTVTATELQQKIERLRARRETYTTLTRLCTLYGVTRAGYYAWVQRPRSAHAERDRQLLQHIQRIFTAACLDAGITPTLPRPLTSANAKHGLFTKEDFAYDAARDAYRCPAARVEVIDARDARHCLPDLNLAHLNIVEQLIANGEILSNRLADVSKCLSFRGPLRPAAWQAGNRDAEAFLGALKRDLVFH